MELTRENLDALYYSLNASLNKGLAQAWPGWQRYCMLVKSTTYMEKYPMSLLTGAMREWIGERVVNELSGKMLDVINRDYEHTEGVSRNDIEDDVLGLYAALFTGMGIEAANLWARLSAAALEDAGKWADDVAFFHASRKIGKATINNIVAAALSVTSYETARAQMMGFLGPDKQPLGLVPDVIMVGNALENTAKRIFKTSLVAVDGVTETNIHENEVEILVNPYIASSNWYLMCTNRGVKPVVVQQRKIGPLVRWDKDTDDCVKNKNRCEYGMHYRGSSAAVAPHLVVKGGA